MERTIDQLGEELLNHCVKANRHDVTNNQIQRILKIGICKTNEVVEHLLEADKINVIGSGWYGII